VKQGKLGYFIGHQTHVQAAEAEEEVVIKAGGAGNRVCEGSNPVHNWLLQCHLSLLEAAPRSDVVVQACSQLVTVLPNHQ
jgi:hypothetical protein